MEEQMMTNTSVMQCLLADLQQIIDKARKHVATTANYELTMMYWHIGERINREVLGNQRAEYGKQIVSTVATQLQLLYGLLHRLIAIDLKLGKFKAQYKGQMELYLRWLETNEMEPGEETPLGLLLCTEGSEEQIELLQLDKAGIRVAQYMTELPPRELLIQQIRKSLETSKRLNLKELWGE